MFKDISKMFKDIRQMFKDIAAMFKDIRQMFKDIQSICTDFDAICKQTAAMFKDIATMSTGIKPMSKGIRHYILFILKNVLNTNNMKKAILNFSRLSVPEKIQKAKTIITQMTDNTHFETPKPALSDISDVIEALETSHEAAQDGSRTKKALMNSHEATLNEMMSLLTAYVQDISGGDEAIILSSGMGVKSKATPPKDLEAPTALKASTRTNSGEAELKWKPVSGAKTYRIEFTKTPDDLPSWTHLDLCTKAKHTVTGLPSVSTIWFRVAAIGPKGKSQWSDPAKAVIA